MRPVAVALGTVREMNEAFGRSSREGGVPGHPQPQRFPEIPGLDLSYRGPGFIIHGHVDSLGQIGELVTGLLSGLRGVVTESSKEPPEEPASGTPVA
jgi:hypothetical protein